MSCAPQGAPGTAGAAVVRAGPGTPVLGPLGHWGGGEVRRSSPVLLHPGADPRHQDDCRDPPPGWRVAAVGALAHLRSLSLFMWPVSRFARGGVEEIGRGPC